MKSALVVGASRGIGRQIALTLSQNGYKVGVAAKTVSVNSKLPGTIHSVTEEIRALGGHAVPIQCDVRDEQHIQSAVNRYNILNIAVFHFIQIHIHIPI